MPALRISASRYRLLSFDAICRFWRPSAIRLFHQRVAVTPPSAAAAAARLDSAALSLSKKSLARRAPARADRPFKGIALILTSTVFLGVSDITAKYLSATLPSIEIAWLRFLVFALIMVPAMVPGTPIYSLKTRSLGLQFMRGAAL